MLVSPCRTRGESRRLGATQPILALRPNRWQRARPHGIGSRRLARRARSVKTAASVTDIAIHTRALSRHFGAAAVVDSLDLDVERGRIFGFLGPNGAGKTTTIRMLTGILRPTGGEGRVVGYDLVTQAEDLKRHIGYVAQHFGLYDDLTAAENLRFYARVYGRPDASILDRLLARYGFDEYRNVLARHLSGGFRQRLALVCALTHAPELLFLDEPTAGVDPAVRKQLWDFFYELADRGTTLFITTHYMEEAERCDRLAFLHRGRLVADGTPDDIKQSFDDRDVFVLRCRYDPRVVAAAGRLDGVQLVNQFGSTLRIVAAKSSQSERRLLERLRLEDRKDVTIARDRPTIEDVFVLLTGAQQAAAGAPQSTQPVGSAQ
jgi:ABC-2 type transport system ATP-binding protein